MTTWKKFSYLPVPRSDMLWHCNFAYLPHSVGTICQHPLPKTEEQYTGTFGAVDGYHRPPISDIRRW